MRAADPLVGYRIRQTSAVRRAGHELRSVRTRFNYLNDHADRYSDADRQAVRVELVKALKRGHSQALWIDRDPRMVRAYRRLFNEVNPPGEPVPSNFTRRLYPRWMYRIRDALAAVMER